MDKRPGRTQEEINTSGLLAIRALHDILYSLQGQAWLSKRNKKLREAKVYEELATAIIPITARVMDIKRCNDNCKGMYFCERKRGHKGEHKEMGLVW